MSRSRSTPYAVLGLLGLGPASGYDIRKEIASSIGHFWSESYGQIYPALRDLTRLGLIQARGAAAGGRERRVYAITAKGRRALEAWRAVPPRPMPVRNELLLKLFFGAGTPGPEIGWLEQLAGEETARLRDFRRVRALLRREHRDHPSLPYWLAVLRYGERRSEAARRWARETRTTLERLPRRDRAVHKPTSSKRVRT